MEYLSLSRKTLIVSTWAPPRPGGSAQHLYNFFSQFNPNSYAIYTRSENMKVDEPGPQLPCEYHFFPNGRSLSVVRKGFRIITERNIDLVYVTADSGRGLVLGLILSLIANRPLVLHFFDIYRGNSFPQPYGVLSWALEPILLFRAARTILPNEAIYEEYHRRYPLLAHKLVCVNNGTFDTTHAKAAVLRHKPPYTIVNTGSIYWAQEESIRCLAEAVRGFGELRAEIYTPRRIQENVARIAKDNPNVTAASLDPSKVAAAQGRATALFVPIARPSVSPIVSLTAVPGRLPEYLVSGRPLIVHAPKESFMARYARRERFALVVESFDPEVLRREILGLIKDVKRQEALIKHAHATFKKFHDARKNARTIIEIIGSVPTKRHA